MKNELFNDVDHLYDAEIEVDSKGRFRCPVCDKRLSTKAGMFRHMKERDCAPPQVVFGDTITEEVALDLFKETSIKYNKNQRTGLSNFRKSKYYKSVAKFVLHCMNNKINSSLFFEWVHLTKKPKYYNHALSLCMKDQSLVDFRRHLIKNEELIDSDSFFEQNRELLKNDFFLVRSIERGDIGFDYCYDNPEIDLPSRAPKFSDPNKMAVLNLINIKEMG